MPKRESSTLALRLNDGAVIDVLRVRDPRARRLRLLVSDRGARLTVPPGASARLAETFLFEHRDWLALQLAKHTANTDHAATLIPEQTTHLPLRGELLPIHWLEGRYAKAQTSEHGIEFYLPDAKNKSALCHAALRDFYLAGARHDIGQWLPRYLPELPRAPKCVRLRPLRSLWGSLSSDGSVSLDLALILGQPSAFEYVLVHELCHLIHGNHSAAFWQEVKNRCPHWRNERQYLRGDGLVIKKQLAGLLKPTTTRA